MLCNAMCMRVAILLKNPAGPCWPTRGVDDTKITDRRCAFLCSPVLPYTTYLHRNKQRMISPPEPIRYLRHSKTKKPKRAPYSPSQPNSRSCSTCPHFPRVRLAPRAVRRRRPRSLEFRSCLPCCSVVRKRCRRICDGTRSASNDRPSNRNQSRNPRPT